MYHSAAKKSSVSSFLQEIWRRRGGGCRHVPLLAEKGTKETKYFFKETLTAAECTISHSVGFFMYRCSLKEV